MNETKCRRIVSARSGGICEICDGHRATEMAHRLAKGRQGKWQPSNILHLCKAMHDQQRDGKGGEPLATKLGQVLPSMVGGKRPDPTLFPVSTRYGYVFLDDEGGWVSVGDEPC